MAIAQPHPTDEIRPMVDIDNDYPQRADRLYDVPCAQNAQGLFSPEACLFVGNLSTRVPAEKLSTDLEALFSRFGRCHVKIKYDGRRRLPTAFLQFEASLTLSSLVSVHSRVIRLREASEPLKTTMEPPDPHGGGVIHASPPANGHAASQLTEILEVPDTPTPSRWNITGPLGLDMNENDQENDPKTEAEPSKGTRILGNSWIRGQASKSHGIVKPQRRATLRPLGGKE
ncbi:hypothetical protein T310_1140, partial [Rasamsonia emersonii CBS 393.64]